MTAHDKNYQLIFWYAWFTYCLNWTMNLKLVTVTFKLHNFPFVIEHFWKKSFYSFFYINQQRLRHLFIVMKYNIEELK